MSATLTNYVLHFTLYPRSRGCAYNRSFRHIKFPKINSPAVSGTILLIDRGRILSEFYNTWLQVASPFELASGLVNLVCRNFLSRSVSQKQSEKPRTYPSSVRRSDPRELISSVFAWHAEAHSRFLPKSRNYYANTRGIKLRGIILSSSEFLLLYVHCSSFRQSKIFET